MLDILNLAILYHITSLNLEYLVVIFQPEFYNIYIYPSMVFNLECGVGFSGGLWTNHRSQDPFFQSMIFSGWWYTYPSEK